MITPDTFRVFSAELQKVGALPGTPKEKALVAASLLGGAATLAAGHRLVTDVKMGEQMRKGGY